MAVPILPSISFGTSRFYIGQFPLKRSTTYSTGILQFQNGQEQRWADRGAMHGFTLQYDDIPLSDVRTLQQFVAVCGGSEGMFQFNFPFQRGENRQYPACRLIDDEVIFTETAENRYSGSLRFRQFGVGGQYVSSTGNADFPILGPAQTWRTGFPFVRVDTYSVDKVDLESGPRVAYAWHNKGLANFPNRPLKRWELNFTDLAVEYVNRLEDHFLRMGGPWQNFRWYDPTDARVYERCRYDMDSLDITHVEVNRCHLTVKIRETFGPGWIA